MYNVWGTIIAVTDGNDNDISSNATHIANINPIRYRGYYYDTEMSFYYLNSRYYDPEICRFINADGHLNADYLLGYNAFAYCYNNPVFYVDHTGYTPSSNEMFKMVLGILPNPKGYTSADVLRQQQAELRSKHGDSIAIGIEYDLGGGWEARIDGENTNTKVQKHVHVKKGKQKYSQNYDGSPHDGSNGSPPNSVLKKLKDQLGWDWKEKEKNYNNRKNKIAIKDYECGYNYSYNYILPPITGDTSTPFYIEWIINLFGGE